MLPNFVIIGAQKSASTFVQLCIKEHPEIYIPTEEISFFESPDYEQQDISSLEHLFKGKKEKRLGIKRPSYIGKPEVPERIRNHLPNAKLIAVLRNPIERLVSAYHHHIKYGFIPARSIEKGLYKLLDGSYFKQYKRSKEIIEFGFYYKYLKEYQYFFKRRQILILLYEDIMKNPLGSIQMIYSFLDVDTRYKPKAIDSRPQAVTYSIPRLRFISLRNSFTFKYNYDRTRLFRKNMNPIDIAIARIITIVDRGLLSKIISNTKPTLSKLLKERLFKVYKEDIEKLQTLIDRDLSHWLN